MLKSTLSYLNEPEGELIPYGLPHVIDSHVHIFPEWVFSAVHKWFDNYAWKIKYRHTSKEIVRFLLGRGIRHIVALQYAHKPGIARQLNDHMIEICQKFALPRPTSTEFATTKRCVKRNHQRGDLCLDLLLLTADIRFE